MQNVEISGKRGGLAALCTLGKATFPVTVSRLSCGGCRATAESDWPAECDFLRLAIDGDIQINGRTVNSRGRVADIRFFGQIHPFVVERLAPAA